MNDAIDILLVDDESRNLDALEAILENPGYRLLRALDADSALRLLIDHDVAAIILDIKMPGTTGFELAQMIKATKRYRQIPILFLTAYHLTDQDMLTGYVAGAADYLTKPLRPEIVRHKVAVFADLYRKSRALTELNEKLEERVRERTAELIRSEASLREADRKKDEFIAVLAHELRNPLAPLSFGLDILAKHMPEEEPLVTDTLARMTRQLKHMVRLIDDLLDISRIGRGTIELRKERFDLSDAIQAAVDSNRPHFERRRQSLTVSADRRVFAFGDPTRIVQIIGNLLHNAAKFTPPGGRISVELAVESDQALVCVSDSGEGIAADQLERVFEMFTRSSTQSKADRGLGIGLALGRRLAELHGGTLTAASEGAGLGTTFTLRLPVIADQSQPALSAITEPPEAVTPQAALDIVLIEDIEDVAAELAQWLGEQGHRVAVANTGTSGVELVAKNEPDVVICDLGLPDIDGVEVCRRIRKLALASQPRVVALTGWGREIDRQRTREAGFDEHLVKPVEAKALRTLLGTIPPRLRLTAS
jgi:signal transduction histidine kinase